MTVEVGRCQSGSTGNPWQEGMEVLKMVTYPDVEVELIGTDGNVFALIGKVSTALKRAGHREGATVFQTKAMNADSYESVLRLIADTVEVS